MKTLKSILLEQPPVPGPPQQGGPRAMIPPVSAGESPAPPQVRTKAVSKSKIDKHFDMLKGAWTAEMGNASDSQKVVKVVTMLTELEPDLLDKVRNYIQTGIRR